APAGAGAPLRAGRAVMPLEPTCSAAQPRRLPARSRPAVPSARIQIHSMPRILWSSSAPTVLGEFFTERTERPTQAETYRRREASFVKNLTLPRRTACL